MSTPQDESSQDRELWRRFADGAPPPGPPPQFDANLLAAYLDGKATAEQTQAMESAMAADPELVDAVADLRSVLASQPASAPRRARARAKMALADLARPPAPDRSVARWRTLHLTSLRLAAAAVIALVSLGGYRVGRATSGMRTQIDATVLSELRLNLGDEQAGSDPLAAFDDFNGNGGDRG